MCPCPFVASLVAGRRPREWSEIKQLLLAVEVLSPEIEPPRLFAAVLDE